MQSYFSNEASNQLCSIKAGKCILEPLADGKFNVTPDKRRGLIQIVKGQDGLTRFRWLDRASNVAVDEFIVIADEVLLKKVDTGRAGDRVYILKWNQVAALNIVIIKIARHPNRFPFCLSG